MIVININQCKPKLLAQYIDMTQPEGFDQLVPTIQTVVPSMTSVVYWHASDTIKIFIEENSDMVLPSEDALALFGEVVSYDSREL